MILEDPQVAWRDCKHCQRWMYDEKTGKPEKLERSPHPDKLVARHGDPPPCRTKKGCPKGTPEKSKNLTFANEEAYAHYLECKATTSFPDDPIVRRNAAVIYTIEESIDKQLNIAQLYAQTHVGLAGGLAGAMGAGPQRGRRR